MNAAQQKQKEKLDLLLMAKPSKRSASFKSRVMVSKKTAAGSNILHSKKTKKSTAKKQKRACQTTYGPPQPGEPSKERSSTAPDQPSGYPGR